MAKTIAIELTSKEAMELISSNAVGTKLTKKIIAALRQQQPYPKGRVAAAVVKSNNTTKPRSVSTTTSVTTN